jgi:hypothetical protein
MHARGQGHRVNQHSSVSAPQHRARAVATTSTTTAPRNADLERVGHTSSVSSARPLASPTARHRVVKVRPSRSSPSFRCRSVRGRTCPARRSPPQRPPPDAPAPLPRGGLCDDRNNGRGNQNECRAWMSTASRRLTLSSAPKRSASSWSNTQERPAGWMDLAPGRRHRTAMVPHPTQSDRVHGRATSSTCAHAPPAPREPPMATAVRSTNEAPVDGTAGHQPLGARCVRQARPDTRAVSQQVRGDRNIRSTAPNQFGTVHGPARCRPVPVQGLSACSVGAASRITFSRCRRSDWESRFEFAAAVDDRRSHGHTTRE